MLPMKKLGCLLFILCLFATVGAVYANTENLSIGAGKQYVSKIDVDSGDRVHITLVGQATSTLSVSIVFPNSTAINLGEVGQFSTSFTSDTKGTCVLNFDNSNSSDLAIVALNYEVEHDILGMPQMIFVLVLIAVLLMFVVAGYIIMNKYS
jgi:hypothetical protein